MKNPLESQDVELFSVGDFGEKGKYTEADLDQIVANYDPSFHEAPICLGHPKDDAPAWGWVQSVKRVGQKLFGRFKDVEPTFADAVQARRFKKRSVALYKTNKGLSLRHVAFLGAMPPEVKGLADVKFKDNGEVMEITFQEETTMDPKDQKALEDSLFTRITTFFSEKFLGGKKGDEPSADAIRSGIEEAMKPIREAEAARAKEFAESQKKLATVESGARAQAAIARVKAKGAWVPAFDKSGVPLIFSALAESTDTVELTFGEGDKKETKQLSRLDLFTEFMESLGQIVPSGKLVNFSESNQGAGKKTPANADPNSVQLNELVMKHAADNKLTFAEALPVVVALHPELTVPGGAAAGQV